MDRKMRLSDLNLFLSLLKSRNARFKKTKAKAFSQGTMNKLASQLHPQSQEFVVGDIIQETPLTKTFRLYAAELDSKPSYFKAGQYISVGIDFEDTVIYRPYSISSTPQEAIQKGFYDITVKNQENGYGCSLIHDTWRDGTRIKTSAPEGFFTYNPIRDSNSLVLIAGGSGITPFKPLVNELLKSNEVRIILFHGAVSEEELIFRNHFEKINLENTDRLRYVPVLSEPGSNWFGESGFIELSLLKKYISGFLKSNFKDISFFLCGPPVMLTSLNKMLQEQMVLIKNIRMEKFFTSDMDLESPYKEFKMVVKIQNKTYNISIRSNETLLDSLETAGLNPPSLCRNGHCGWCRSKLIKGTVESHCGVIRSADIRFDNIHTCCSYPVSDIVLEVPVNTII